jgi:hypothetical protein
MAQTTRPTQTIIVTAPPAELAPVRTFQTELAIIIAADPRPATMQAIQNFRLRTLSATYRKPTNENTPKPRIGASSQALWRMRHLRLARSTLDSVLA